MCSCWIGLNVSICSFTPWMPCRERQLHHHLFQELLQQRSSAEIGADQVKSCTARLQPGSKSMEMLEPGYFDLAACQMKCLVGGVNREDRPNLERWAAMLLEETIQLMSGSVDDQGMGATVLTAT